MKLLQPLSFIIKKMLPCSPYRNALSPYHIFFFTQQPGFAEPLSAPGRCQQVF
jgi:hypothetical protein